MHPRSLVLRAALALLPVAASPALLTAQTAALRAEVFGTILNRLTGEPVAEATAVLSPEDAEEESWTDTSDENGRLRTPLLPLGTYELAITLTGYATLEGSVHLDGPGAVDLRVPDGPRRLRAGAGNRRGRSPLPPRGGGGSMSVSTSETVTSLPGRNSTSTLPQTFRMFSEAFQE